jgi:hypothetical protein
VSGRKAQSVIEFDLNPLLGDPREQIRRATCDLPSDSNVRVVCRMAPVPLGFPSASHTYTAWFRRDLTWQWLGTPKNWEWARDWELIANYLGGNR